MQLNLQHLFHYTQRFRTGITATLSRSLQSTGQTSAVLVSDSRCRAAPHALPVAAVPRGPQQGLLWLMEVGARSMDFSYVNSETKDTDYGGRSPRKPLCNCSPQPPCVYSEAPMSEMQSTCRPVAKGIKL